jgi:integrase
VTVFKHPRGTTWRYDFWWKGKRYQGTTDQLTRSDAELAEAAVKKRLRQEAWGIAPMDRTRTPTFTEWAAYFAKHQRARVRRPDLQERTLRMVLAFWGRRPRKEPVAGGVYHDLRLADPIIDVDWIVRFEEWMTERGIAGSTKNSYRSVMSGMYRLALRPTHRKKTHVVINPFIGVERDRVPSRIATLSVAEVQAWIRESPPHVRVAIALAALAPKLRLASILALRWRTNINRELTYITVHEHKTIAATGPQVVPIDPQLRAILEPLSKRYGTHVITYRGHPVKSIKTALKRAARDAGLNYGRAGVTFHSLRHTMATLLAELGVPEQQRQATMGHLDSRTTQKYTHLRPAHERAPLALLSAAVPLLALFEEAVSTGTPVATREDPERLPQSAAPLTLASTSITGSSSRS